MINKPTDEVTWMIQFEKVWSQFKLMQSIYFWGNII